MSNRRLLISFSGGETSAYMTKLILDEYCDRYDEVAVVFANTGQENEQTLEFVKRCDEAFGFNTVWIEAVVHHGSRRSPTHKIVTYETADRTGQPFEEMIKKYGIPNKRYAHCTRSLKYYPITSYVRSLGWKANTYDTAIGIRIDEIDRMTTDSRKVGIVYPLISWQPTTKPQINSWWAKQPFRLPLKGYQGNCKWCWKKSLRKHLTIMSEMPEAYEFPARMEAQYSYVGPEFDKAVRHKPLPENYRRVFFRENRSTEDIKRIYEEKKGQFIPANDDAQVFDETLDVGGGCSESCEVYTDL